MIYSNFSSLIKNSKGNYYRFYINKDKQLICEEYSYNGLMSSSVFKENIYDYSLEIDDNDVIHILCLYMDGVLKYSLYPNGQEEKTLSSFELRDSRINFLTLKLLSSEVHIFYMVSSKQNIYKLSLYHNMWRDSKWTSEKISDITSLKYPHPFFVEYDNKNNLYFFFSKNSANLFSIKKYNSEFNIWTDFEENLIIDKYNFTSFFVSDKGMGILCYCQTINDNVMSFIRYRDLTSIYSIWSDPVLLSNSNVNIPSISSRNGTIYITWEEGTNIVYRKNSDVNHNWSEKKVLTAKNEDLLNSIYISNSIDDANFKSSYIFYKINGYPIPIVDEENGKIASTNYPQIEDIATKITQTDVSPENTDPSSALSSQLNILSQENYKKGLDIETLSNMIKERDLTIEKLKADLEELNIKYLMDIQEYNKTITNLNEQLNQVTSDFEKKEEVKKKKVCRCFRCFKKS